MLHLGSLKNTALEASGDLLHLNDVEPFPSTMTPGFFGPGDVLVSLRNVNTVFVFNADTRKIKFVTTGRFTRQHDPDFIDGNRFSVFDNMGVQPGAKDRQSRIVIVTAPEQSVEVYYEGTPAHPFYTDIMGRHQWLPNGNLLITETRRGRAFEINRQGEIVWEYLNPSRQRHRRYPRRGHAAAGGIRPALQPAAGHVIRQKTWGQKSVRDRVRGTRRRISAIGAFLAMVAGVFVAIAGFVWYPIKRLIRRIKGSPSTERPDSE